MDKKSRKRLLRDFFHDFCYRFLRGEADEHIYSQKHQVLRQQNGLTQEQLAEKLFVTWQTVSLWDCR